MIATLQMVFGVLIGFLGFLGISSSPVPGVSALFLGGFLVLASIERLCHA